MKLNSTNLLYTLKITRMAFTLACLTLSLSLSQVASAVGIIDLGSLSFTSAAASFEQISTSAAATIDGIIPEKGQFNGWGVGGSTASENTITWAFSHTTPTLAQGERVGFYTYTIDLHHAFNNFHTLKTYRLSIKDAGADTFSTITDYESVSITGTTSISVDANGLITSGTPATSNDEDLHIHSIVFKSNRVLNDLALTEIEGWTGTENFILSEVEGSVSAHVVPEPSNYALLLGCVAFIALALRKHKQTGNA